MTHLSFARDLLATFCGLQGAATLAIDLNRTHATNPSWPAHARFHVVWQSTSTAMLALLEVVLVLIRGPFEAHRFYLAAVLAGIPMMGFMLALIGRKAYRGALWDPDGILPIRVRVLRRDVQIDLNLAVVILGMFSLAAIIAIYVY